MNDELEKANMEEKVIEIKQDTKDLTLKEIIVSVSEWYRYVLSKWVVILVFSIIGGGIGFAYAMFTKPVYTATTTFVLEEGNNGGGGLGGLGGLASMVGVDVGGGGGGIFQGDNIIELYKSRTMIEKTLLTEVVFDGKKELLVNRYIDFNNLRKKWDKKPELKNIEFNIADINNAKGAPRNFSRLQDSILSTIVEDINKKYLVVAKPDKKLSIIKADIRATDEFFAKAFDNQIVKNVNDFYVQTKTKKSLENVLILQQKTDSVRAVMNGSIYKAAAVSDATPNLNPTRQVQRSAPVQQSQFSAETNKTVLSELVKNLEMSKISLRKETPLIQVVDEPILPLMREGVGKVKGIIVGIFLAAIAATVLLIFRRLFKMILV